MTSLIKQPSAWIPITMSIAALALLIGHVAIFGIVRETDEGTSAHIFQLLMGGQVPIILFFVIKWLSKSPKQATLILTLQICAWVTAWLPVFLLEL